MNITDEQLAEIYNEQLQCHVTNVEYDFLTRSGKLVAVEGDCTSMDGVIAFFQKIDPRVQIISTYSGAKPDAFYRNFDGEWRVGDR